MSWYPTDTRPREPGMVLKTWRKMSALVRWIILVGVCGLVIAAVIAFGVSTLFTMLENGK
jgi:high-affinity Fe2+/Pb2+ permease